MLRAVAWRGAPGVARRAPGGGWDLVRLVARLVVQLLAQLVECPASRPDDIAAGSGWAALMCLLAIPDCSSGQGKGGGGGGQS